MDIQESEQQSDQIEEATAIRSYPLASRLQRLAAKILDGIAEMMVIVPVVIFLGIGNQMQVMMEQGTISLSFIMQVTVVGFVAHLVLHGYLLYFYGQTIGKRIMGIAIVNAANKVPNFNRIIALRYLPFYLAAQIPFISTLALVDVLFIFREDRRCLHDLLASTQVIDVSARQRSVAS